MFYSSKIWMDGCRTESFYGNEENPVQEVFLSYPKFSREFIIYTDARITKEGK